jgi:hypothetical protein
MNNAEQARPGIGKAAVLRFVQIRGICVWRLTPSPHGKHAGVSQDARVARLTVDNFRAPASASSLRRLS